MITKYITAIVAVAAFAGGSFFGSKVLTKKCPDCVINCPPAPPCPPAVNLQSFDLEKLNNKKGSFTYSPQLSNVRINVDSAMLVRLLQTAK